MIAYIVCIPIIIACLIFIGYTVGKYTATDTKTIREQKKELENIKNLLNKAERNWKDYERCYVEQYNNSTQARKELTKVMEAAKTWEISYKNKPKPKKTTEKAWDLRKFISSAEMNCKNISEEVKSFGDKEVSLNITVDTQNFLKTRSIFETAGHLTIYKLAMSGPANRVANDVESHFKAKSFPLSNGNGGWTTNDIFSVVCALDVTSMEEALLPIVQKVEVPVFNLMIKEVAIPAQPFAEKDNLKDEIDKPEVKINHSDPAFLTAVEMAMIEIQSKGKSLKKESTEKHNKAPENIQNKKISTNE